MQLPLTLAIHRNSLLTRLLCRGDIVALTLQADGRLGIERRDGTMAEADVDPDTTVFPWLVVLRLRAGGRIESLALPPVAMDADSHRRLRLWLKWLARV